MFFIFIFCFLMLKLNEPFRVYEVINLFILRFVICELKCFNLFLLIFFFLDPGIHGYRRPKCCESSGSGSQGYRRFSFSKSVEI